MTKKELGKLISDSTAETIGKNAKYLSQLRKNELNQLFESNPKVRLEEAIPAILQTYMESSIELATMNTLKTLEKLGVVSLELDD